MNQSESLVVLFSDLVGSTALANRVDPDTADEVRHRHFEVLRQAIVNNEGTEVKNLGDGVMVVFTSASAALACAVAMQQGVDYDNRFCEEALALGLRIGLSAGETVCEGDDYFGDPVIEAARLCAKAEGGQILLAEWVRALAGRRASFSFTSLGELSLKGIPDPLETLCVSWEPLPDVEEQLPQGSATLSEPITVALPTPLCLVPDVGRMIGRDQEIDAVTQAYKTAAAGEGREVLMVSGEAGVGKSTVVATLARRAHELGAIVLYGHYDEEMGLSYQGIAEALTHYTQALSDEVLRAHVDEDGPELCVMVPALKRRLTNMGAPRSSDPDTMRYLVFSATVSLLAKAQMAQPLLLVLEDLQWADTQSLQLLRHLVANSDHLRLMVVGTYRDEVQASHPLGQLLAALRREQRVHHVTLSGLDQASVLSFLETALSQSLDDSGAEVAQALCQETDGNPFFVAEVLRHLLETGAFYQDDQGALVTTAPLSELALPQSVRQVISARVARLGEEATKVLSTASVIGRDFDLEVLAQASHHDEDDLLDLLDEAARAAVLSELEDQAGRYRFSHALIAHTLATDLGPTRRARAHREVARALEDLFAHESGLEHFDTDTIKALGKDATKRGAKRLSQLAYHYARAPATKDQDKAIAWCGTAGWRALAALAPDEARTWFEEAMRLVGQDTSAEGSDPDAIDLLIGLGTAQRHAGDPAHRATLLEAARRAEFLGDANRLAEAALINSEGGLSSGLGEVDTDKVACLEAAVAASGQLDPGVQALILATLCSELTYGALERRLELAEQARAIVASLDDPRVAVEVAIRLQAPLELPETLAGRLDETAEALEAAERLGDPLLSFWSSWLRTITALQAAVPDEVERCSTIMASRAEELGQPNLVEIGHVLQAVIAQVHGDPTDAEEHATAALNIGMETGVKDAWSVYGAQLIIVRWEQGRLSELVELIAETAAQNPGVPAFHAAHALASIESGQEDEARLLLHDAMADGFSSLPSDGTRLTALHAYAEVAFQLGDKPAAELLLELLRPWVEQMEVNAGVTTGPVAHYLGGLATVLARCDEAERYFAEATRISDLMLAPFFGARTRLAWAKMLLLRQAPGDDDKADELLASARTSSSDHGYEVVRNRIDALTSLSVT